MTTANPTTRLGMYSPTTKTNLWGIICNSNFSKVDEEFQRFATEFMGSATSEWSGFDDVSDKFDTFDSAISDIKASNIDALEMSENITIDAAILRATYLSDHPAEYYEAPTYEALGRSGLGSICLDESENRWKSSSVVPFSYAAEIFKINATSIYCALAGRPYRITRRNREYTVPSTGSYMFVVSNHEISGLDSRIRRSYPSFGQGNSNTFNCPGIGAISDADAGDWIPQVGDWFVVGEKRWIISAVTLDAISLIGYSNTIPNLREPDWKIEGMFDPYMGIVDYDEAYWNSPSAMVLAVVEDGVLSIVNETQLQSSFGIYVGAGIMGNNPGAWCDVVNFNSSSQCMTAKKCSHQILDPFSASPEITYMTNCWADPKQFMQTSFTPAHDEIATSYQNGSEVYVRPSDGFGVAAIADGCTNTFVIGV